jgi:predicted RNase H-like HicB family nuclease
MEKRMYNMFVHKGENSGLWCDFPDLPGCFSDGENLDDLMKNAKDAMESWLEVSLEHNEPLPTASSVDNLKAMADASEEPVLFVVPVTGYLHGAPVRINITSTDDKIAEITDFAKRIGKTRSEFMVDASLAYVRANA